MTEEQRATAFRADQAARAVYRRAQAVALSGSPVARAALDAAWAPVVAWQQELQAHPEHRALHHFLRKD